MALPILINATSPTTRDQRRSRGEYRYSKIAGYGARLQGCNPFKCAALAITCATACFSGVGTLGCIACLGSAYDDCKDCF